MEEASGSSLFVSAMVVSGKVPCLMDKGRHHRAIALN